MRCRRGEVQVGQLASTPLDAVDAGALNVFVANSAGQVQLVWKANNSTWRDPTPLG